MKRISLGFDLRLNPSLQVASPLQRSQCLDPERLSPVSADPNVWLEGDAIESLSQGALADLYNPLRLSRSVDLLLDACKNRGVPIVDLWPICVTGYEANLLALAKRYGPGYFDNQVEEAELLSQGWR